MFKRSSRTDRNGIGMGHPDRGCDFHEFCLTCPLILCRYEEGYDLAAVIALTEKATAEQRRREALARESVIEEAREIMLEVAKEHGVTVHQITSRAKFNYIVKPRWEIMRRLREELGLNLDVIGRVVHRDHSTVIYGLRRAAGETMREAQQRRNGVTP